jgi:hypothetical protein
VFICNVVCVVSAFDLLHPD